LRRRIEMRRAIIDLAVAGFVVCASGASAMTWSGNLLENPGAEAGDLTGWMTDDPVIVVASRVQPEYSGDVYPYSGEWFFNMASAEAAPSGTVTSRLLSQDVDVSSYASQIDAGLVLFDASVFMQTEDTATFTGADYGQLTLWFMGDGSGEIGSLSTGLVVSPNLVWIEETLDGLLPLGTRSIRFELLGEKHERSFINAFFDSCSLEVAVVPEPGTVLLLGIGTLVAMRRRGDR
jgi:hypothetical protein